MRREVVSLVRPVFPTTAAVHDNVILVSIFDKHYARLVRRVLAEVRADEGAVPWVVGHAGCCAVKGDDAAAGVDEVF